MKHSYAYILLLSLPVLLTSLTSCGQKPVTDGGLVSVQYEKLPQGEDLLLSEWVGEPEFIALDSSVPEALTDGGNLTVSEHYIGVFPNTERPFKLFDRATGKFLCNVGNIGRGPGEYNRISFAQIDETGGKIWISTLYDNKIHTYDLSTGRFLEDLPLAYEAEGNPNQGYNFMVDGSAQTVTIATTPFDDGCPVIAWCQDYEGNVLWEIPKTGTIPENAILSLHTSLNVDGALDICQVSMNTQQDTLFIIQDRELSPLLTMKLGETTEPNALTIGDGDYMHDPYILPDYAVVNINKTKMVQSRNTGSGVSISMEMDLQPSIILDRRTGDVSRRTIINDILTNDSTGPTFKNGYLVSYYSAESFREAGPGFLENGNLSSSARKCISDILKNISEDDNNVIILAPLK